jgi:hypothetical protein
MRKLSLTAAFLMLAGALVIAQEPRPKSSGRSYSDYSIITQRNIFSSSRRAPVAGTRSVSTSTTPSIETITLVGVVLRDTGNVAIFASAISDESGARKQDETVAGYAITDITTSQVNLTRDSKTLEWTVGGILRRIDGGDWYMPQAPGAATDITADPAAEAAILKRMRARRAQESANE